MVPAPMLVFAPMSDGSERLVAVEYIVPQEAVEDEAGERNVYLLTQKSFRLNGRPHQLALIQQLTRELSRQEVATWKKVIRVISHELNNSVAPISSLAHTGRRLAEAGELAKLDRALTSITDRARHLAGFIEGYARFARIPEPALEAVDWRDFLDSLDGAARRGP